MNGVYENAMLKALKNYANLDEIVLCVDNDEGGIEAVDRLRDIFFENGYKNMKRIASNGRDWNELLKNNLKDNYKSYTDRAKAAVKKDNMVKQMRSVLDDLRFSVVQTREQMKATAGKLFLLADCALRCRTEELLTEEQTMKNEQAPSESEALVLSFG